MKKVLIITYYWPPAGGAGVQRVLKFAKYLPQFGWTPIILTVENPDCPVIDETLLNDIPTECKVYKTKSIEPFELYKTLTGKSKNYKIPSDVITKSTNLSLTEKISKWLRINLFIPDAKIGWKYFAVKEGLKIIRKEKVDLIFSTSPPHTVQLIANKLAKFTKLKWVADFRDPWMEIVHYQNLQRNFFTKLIDQNLEKKVLKNADSIITISDDIVDLFKSKIGEKKYFVIPNGFDETDFHKTEKVKNNIFTIAYTGVITKTRVPFVFLSALKKFINEDDITNIKFIIAGKTCSEFSNEVRKLNLENYVKEKGFLPHHESTNILQNADVLLLIIDDVPNNKGFLTGKIFEYLGSKKPIYAVGPIDGNANEIIVKSDCGKMVDYKDEKNTYNLLKEMYDNWQNNSFNYKYNVEEYSRKNLTKKLSQIFDEEIK
ncbi:MAG: glycosyltransferase family 4 protein [Ignavibacteriae bacterium]|nr:glycosyltransferase family 4 protein [Ignavibacteriota bacterium]